MALVMVGILAFVKQDGTTGFFFFFFTFMPPLHRVILYTSALIKYSLSIRFEVL